VSVGIEGAKRSLPRPLVGDRLAWLGLSLAVLAGVTVVMLATPTPSAFAAGLLPPANPLANIAQASPNLIQAVDAARSDEGVGALVFDQNAFGALPNAEQIFVIENLERTGRGLAPFTAMTAQLDGSAQAAAAGDRDPSFPGQLSGGGALFEGGGIWAGGWSSALAADYEWMYQDGWGGSEASTLNADCSTATSPGCWSHRDVILADYSRCLPSGGSPVLVMGAAYDPSSYPGGSAAAVFVCSNVVPTDEVFTWTEAQEILGIAPSYVAIVATADGSGYWEARSDGTIMDFGDAVNFGDMANRVLNAPIVSMVATPDGGGYWLLGADGGVFSFGDARFFGSTGSIPLNAPVVSMAVTPDGGGYWFVASDGGIFSFGDASFYGSMGGQHLNEPVVGMAVDQETGGYWLVGADGGIFSFNATFFGSTGSIHLNEPIVSIAAAPGGTGYDFVASDGGVFCFNTTFDGSMGGTVLAAPVTAMAVEPGGYWLLGADGGIFSFGGVGFYGSPA